MVKKGPGLTLAVAVVRDLPGRDGPRRELAAFETDVLARVRARLGRRRPSRRDDQLCLFYLARSWPGDESQEGRDHYDRGEQQEQF